MDPCDDPRKEPWEDASSAWRLLAALCCLVIAATALSATIDTLDPFHTWQSAEYFISRPSSKPPPPTATFSDQVLTLQSSPSLAMAASSGASYRRELEPAPPAATPPPTPSAPDANRLSRPSADRPAGDDPLVKQVRPLWRAQRNGLPIEEPSPARAGEPAILAIPVETRLAPSDEDPRPRRRLPVALAGLGLAALAICLAEGGCAGGDQQSAARAWTLARAAAGLGATFGMAVVMSGAWLIALSDWIIGGLWALIGAALTVFGIARALWAQRGMEQQQQPELNAPWPRLLDAARLEDVPPPVSFAAPGSAVANGWQGRVWGLALALALAASSGAARTASGAPGRCLSYSGGVCVALAQAVEIGDGLSQTRDQGLTTVVAKHNALWDSARTRTRDAAVALGPASGCVAGDKSSDCNPPAPDTAEVVKKLDAQTTPLPTVQAKNVTPWQKEVDLAGKLLTWGGLILGIAAALIQLGQKMGHFGLALVMMGRMLCYAAAGLGAIAAVLGLMTLFHGQVLQSALLIFGGVGLVIAALKTAKHGKNAYHELKDKLEANKLGLQKTMLNGREVWTDHKGAVLYQDQDGWHVVRTLRGSDGQLYTETESGYKSFGDALHGYSNSVPHPMDAPTNSEGTTFTDGSTLTGRVLGDTPTGGGQTVDQEAQTHGFDRARTTIDGSPVYQRTLSNGTVVRVFKNADGQWQALDKNWEPSLSDQDLGNLLKTVHWDETPTTNGGGDSNQKITGKLQGQLNGQTLYNHDPATNQFLSANGDGPISIRGSGPAADPSQPGTPLSKEQVEQLVDNAMKPSDPPELKKWAMAVMDKESGFDPTAYNSHGRSNSGWTDTMYQQDMYAHAGLGQFDLRTAGNYGLADVVYKYNNKGQIVGVQEVLADYRADPTRSANAVVSYLRDLHNQTGNWFKTAEAYNQGTGNMNTPAARQYANAVQQRTKKYG